MPDARRKRTIKRTIIIWNANIIMKKINPLRKAKLRWILDDCSDKPDDFNEIVLKRPPYWSRQVEAARAVATSRDTVIYSGNAVGKDYLVGGLVPWWLLTRENSLVIVTGP